MRCFLAAEIPEEARKKLSELARELKRNGIDAKPVEKENLHVTLAFFGEISDAEANQKIEIIKKTVSEIAPFSVKIAGTGFLPSERLVRVFYARTDSPELIAAQKKIALALNHHEDHPFTGHVTLARVRSPKNLEVLREIKRKNEATEFGSYRAEKIVFKKSSLTRGGPVYENLAEIRFCGES